MSHRRFGGLLLAEASRERKHQHRDRARPHRITRKADEQYIPPGRLRTFDLIVYEEISQLEDTVWQQVRTAVTELNPHPFVSFVGNFKQLQPAHGEPGW